MKLSVISNSALKAARSCRRYYRLRYGLGYRPVEDAAATRFGTLVHAALEAWWISAMFTGEPSLTAALRAIEAHATEGSDAFEIVKAKTLIAGYHVQWREQPFDVLAVEAEFLGPLINPTTGEAHPRHKRGGKIDAIVRERETGRKLLVEHKTSAEDIRPGSDYWRRLRLDSQVSTYHDGAGFLGHEVEGCLYDVVAKPWWAKRQTVRREPRYTRRCWGRAGAPSHAPAPCHTSLGCALYKGDREYDETPEEFGERIADRIGEDPGAVYARGPVVRLGAEIDAARLDDWQTVESIDADEAAGRYPRNPDACLRYGRTCEFFGVCTGAASLDDPTFRRVSDPHSELSLHLGQPEVATE